MTEIPRLEPNYRWCEGKSISEMMGPTHPRYVVETARPWMEAYCSLDEGELQHRTGAVLRHGEGFAYWMAILALYRAAFTGVHDLSSEPPGERRISAEFRLDLLALAGGNVKLALDACLAGYYSGCMALERHMLETWRRVVYSRLHPEDIWRWLPLRDWPKGMLPAAKPKEVQEGKMPTFPPSAKEIAAVIDERGDGDDNGFLPKMEAGFAYLNHHSHPTIEGAAQTWALDGSGNRFFGPTLNDLYAVRSLEWGLFAGLILLTEVGRMLPRGGSENWHSQLDLLKVEAARWGIAQKERFPENPDDSGDPQHGSNR
ncbi:MAG: hypothetical protein U0031_09485 [Thermomicrobiales bacterium]